MNTTLFETTLFETSCETGFLLHNIPEVILKKEKIFLDYQCNFPSDKEKQTFLDFIKSEIKKNDNVYIIDFSQKNFSFEVCKSILYKDITCIIFLSNNEEKSFDVFYNKELQEKIINGKVFFAGLFKDGKKCEYACDDNYKKTLLNFADKIWYIPAGVPEKSLLYKKTKEDDIPFSIHFFKNSISKNIQHKGELPDFIESFTPWPLRFIKLQTNFKIKH